MIRRILARIAGPSTIAFASLAAGLAAADLTIEDGKLPACGQPDAECYVHPAADAEVCRWFRAHPAKEHIFFTFSQVYACWARGGDDVGGIDLTHCRPGFDGIGPQITLAAFDGEYIGHAAWACSRASGIPQPILQAATGNEEFDLPERCADWPKWSRWQQWPLNQAGRGYAQMAKDVPDQEDVPDACLHLQLGPG